MLEREGDGERTMGTEGGEMKGNDRGGAGSGSEDEGEFKAGWSSIFRMNQAELEGAIRRVSTDASLDPRRKAYLMQNLMTR